MNNHFIVLIGVYSVIALLCAGYFYATQEDKVEPVINTAEDDSLLE